MEEYSKVDVSAVEDIQMHGPETVIKKLEQNLEEHDILFLFNNTSPEIRKLLVSFLKSQALANAGKKILVLAVEGVQNASYGKQHCIISQIAKEDYGILQKLYRMYEFSDRVRVMETEGQYGSLKNYVCAGVLTEEEMFEALLH